MIPVRIVHGLVLSWIGLSPAAIEPASVRAAEDRPARAYDVPLPVSARLDMVALRVLDDETSRPVADAEVRIRNEVDWRTHTFRTDTRGRLRFECASRRDEPMGASRSGRRATSPSARAGAMVTGSFLLGP